MTDWSGRISVGSKIKFAGERLRYTVQARSDRYVICTKPFNPRKTVLYSIIDFERNVRGRDNLIFGMGYETRQQCEDNLAQMTREDCPVEVSRRNFVELEIESVS